MRSASEAGQHGVGAPDGGGHGLPRGHRIVAAGELLHEGSVLDVGAGSCALRRYARGPYVAVDTHFPPAENNVHRVKGSVTSLPFRTATFDSVVCLSVLQYVTEVRKALGELARVCRPRGQVLILVPNMAYVRNVLTLVRGRFPRSSKLDDWNGGTVRYFTWPDFRPALGDAGLRVVSVRCTGRARAARSRFPARLGADLLIEATRA